MFQISVCIQSTSLITIGNRNLSQVIYYIQIILSVTFHRTKVWRTEIPSFCLQSLMIALRHEGSQAEEGERWEWKACHY